MIIRRATLDDSAFIATCLLLAMEDIVYKFMGRKDHEKAKEFMLYFAERESNQYSYQNCWVAEVDKRVVAAVNLYDGARLRELRQPVIEYIRSQFNSDFEPEDETQAGEYYIDSLGVSPDQQGKGIGSKVLRFLIDEYVDRRGMALGLLVDEENPEARRLYLKLGFKSAEKKVLFGKNMEHLQIAAFSNQR
jgi:ribosomal protein S18 acetylase RimI-like enzyme